MSALTPNSTSICAGGLIFDISTNKILVVQGTRKWSLPKGHIEKDEKAHSAAEREIMEETGIQVSLNEDWPSIRIKKCTYYYIILADASKAQLAPKNEEEILQIKWCSINDLIHLDSNKQLRLIIEQWRAFVKYFYNSQDKLVLNGGPMAKGR